MSCIVQSVLFYYNAMYLDLSAKFGKDKSRNGGIVTR